MSEVPSSSKDGTGEEKHYRVVKTMLPSHVGGGPCGFGDPENRTLRRAERDFAVPRMIKTDTKNTKCAAFYESMMQCTTENRGLISFLGKCQQERDNYNACMTKWCNDPEYVAQKTEEYLDKRSEFRQNCETSKEKKLYDYRWRKYLKEQEKAEAEAKAALIS